MGEILKLICVLPLLFCLNEQVSLQLDSKIKEGTSVEFLKFSGPGKYDNYLIMNLPFEPMIDFLYQVQAVEDLTLKSRGEAHITVLTPLEYWNILRPLSITMTEIDHIAQDMQIQSSHFEILCLGEGKAVLGDKEQKTFFIVVQSQQLLEIRREIQKLVVSKGGAASDFDPSHFYPHITVGYTEEDLHESHGVMKDIHSCIYPIKPK